MIAHQVDLALSGARIAKSTAFVSLNFAFAEDKSEGHAVDLEMTQRQIINTGYFAGEQDAIVTENAKPARCQIMCLNADDLSFVSLQWSLPNGHYMIRDLDPTKKYLFFARSQVAGIEPAGWDHVKPSTALSVEEQRNLYESWQR